MVSLDCNAGIQALTKRAHRVGQHQSRNFSHHSYYLVLQFIKGLVRFTLIDFKF